MSESGRVVSGEPVDPAPAAEEATAAHKGRKPRAKKPKLEPRSEGEQAPLHPFFKKMSVMRLDRAQIKEAEYNPRAIDAPGQVKLKNGLRKFGMVEPLILNIRTGNLVAGHQRLNLMDQEYGRKDYSVEASVIDLSETEEKELNVLLNNPGAQGFFDFTKLGTMIASDADFDVEIAGFDPVALKADLMAFAPDVLSSMDFKHVFGDPDAPDEAAADAETIKTMKAGKEDYKEVAADVGKDGFFITVVFGTVAEKEKWCEAFGVNPQARNCIGRVIARNMRPTAPGESGVDIGWEPPPDPDMSTTSKPNDPEPDAPDGEQKDDTQESPDQ